ncbi:MAG TPA: 2Fe-2S iron-sulfur cluster-binding protein, partial [Nitrososphaera sp.]|nr:2Fe-2S iron-sulfur cluster-binding protein [Nitrososphaera sp.]
MTEQLIEKIETMEKKHEKEKRQREKEYPKSSLTLKIYRANRRAGESQHYDRIEVPVQRWTTVLDALLYAKAYKDQSIGIRYSCRMASCGSCGMKINGIPRLACYTKVSELQGREITVEPLSNFPHIRDLVTDFSQFFAHHHNVEPYIQNDNADMQEKNKLTEFIQTPEEVDKYLQFSYC